MKPVKKILHGQKYFNLKFSFLHSFKRGYSSHISSTKIALLILKPLLILDAL